MSFFRDILAGIIRTSQPFSCNLIPSKRLSLPGAFVGQETLINTRNKGILSILLAPEARTTTSTPLEGFVGPQQ